MQFVSTSVIGILLAGLLLWLGPYRGLWVFMVSLPLGATAAVNFPAVGGASLLVSDVLLLVLLLQLGLRGDWLRQALGTLRPYQPGFWLLMVLLIAAVSAIFLPRLFAGQTEAFQVVRSAEKALPVLQPLAPSNGNVAQLFRLLLSASAFLTLATLFRCQPTPSPIVTGMAVALAAHAALGVADVGSYALGRPDLLKGLRSSGYQMLDHQMLLGAKRMVGGFPEPSAFGYYSIGLFGFWLRYWLGARGNGLALLCLIVSSLLVLRSTSSGTYVALAVLGVLCIGFSLRTVDLDRLRHGQVRMLVGCVALFLLMAGVAVLTLNLFPAAARFLDTALFSKLSSASGIERLSWNRQAMTNFRDTWTLGAGLGSVRGNGWLGATLASLGLIGTLFFAMFLFGVARARARRPGSEQALTVSALQYGCAAVFLQALVTQTTPNLGTAFFAMAGLAVGLARGSVLARTAEQRNELQLHLPQHELAYSCSQKTIPAKQTSEFERRFATKRKGNPVFWGEGF